MSNRISKPQCSYYVDEKLQQTSKEELTVQRILEKAGIQIETQEDVDALLWELRGEETVKHRDPNERIRMEEDMRFVTRIQGSQGKGRSGEGNVALQGAASGSPETRSPLSPQSGGEGSIDQGPPIGPSGPQVPEGPQQTGGFVDSQKTGGAMPGPAAQGKGPSDAARQPSPQSNDEAGV